MESKKRKRYEKPDLKEEKIIETAALACGKCVAANPISQAACKGRPRIS